VKKIGFSSFPVAHRFSFELLRIVDKRRQHPFEREEKVGNRQEEHQIDWVSTQFRY
jgi:hypothetical protein